MYPSPDITDPEDWGKIPPFLVLPPFIIILLALLFGVFQ